MTDSDCDLSAEAWIASQGQRGDWMREHVLDPGLRLVHFDKPAPVSGEPERVRKYWRVPYALLL